jgi:hypothetical protein
VSFWSHFSVLVYWIAGSTLSVRSQVLTGSKREGYLESKREGYLESKRVGRSVWRGFVRYKLHAS